VLRKMLRLFVNDALQQVSGQASHELRKRDE